jgi:hypothetical protein
VSSDIPENDDNWFGENGGDKKIEGGPARPGYFDVVLEETTNFLVEPRVVRFYIQLIIFGSGLVLLRILADRDFPLRDTFLIMSLWFILLLFLPIPKGGKSDIDPFND